MTTISYADDTLVMVGGDSVDAKQEHANATLKKVMETIRRLELHLTVYKTQAVVFTRVYKVMDPYTLGGKGRPA